MSNPRTFQEIVLSLQTFWSSKGCIILPSIDLPVGAGTFHPATALYTLDKNPTRVAYLQPCRRPQDGRYGTNPNRLQRYYQFQVLLKPIPLMNPRPYSAMGLYEESLATLGVSEREHDVRFFDDDWSSPTIGAAGLGYEVWCDGFEISQLTYFQQMGGLALNPQSVELTYGLERLACIIQKVDSIYDIEWHHGTTYGDLHSRQEKEYSTYNYELSSIDNLNQRFAHAQAECEALINRDEPLPLPAYECVLEASHVFNLADARGVSADARQVMMLAVRKMMKSVCEAYVNV